VGVEEEVGCWVGEEIEGHEYKDDASSWVITVRAVAIDIG